MLSIACHMDIRVMRAALLLFCIGECSAATSGVAIATGTDQGAAEEIPATLLKPEGAGPFPAVVIMHDCSGVGPRASGAPARWAEQLVQRGFVAVIPDSFTTRGFADGVCTADTAPRRVQVNELRRARDAYAALAYLRSLPYVDGARVGIMGGSHGGSATLSAMVAPQSGGEPLAREKRSGFAAAVALYPGCGARYGAWRVTRSGGAYGTITDYSGVYQPIAPLYILIGESDDWTPAEQCRKLTATAQQAGYQVAIKTYPGAHHAFDSSNPVRYVAARTNANATSGRGATTGGNAEAWKDSLAEVTAYFAKHLAQPRHADPQN